MKTSALGKWKFAQVDMAALAVIIACAMALYWFGVRPAIQANERSAAQQSQLRDQRRNLALMNSRAAEGQKALDGVRTELAKFPVQLEPAGNVNSRIGRLTELANDHGLKVDEIEPASATYGRDYGSVPIRLNGNGGYKAWTAFLHDLSKSFPDTSVDSFQLSGKPDTPAAPMEFRVNLIWFVSPQAVMAKS